MSGEITQWLAGSPAKRQQSGELARIENDVQRAEAQVAGLNRVGQQAMFQTMMTGLVRREAERIAPDQAELYAMIAIAAGMGSVHIMNSMYRRR